jgi:hypothetical protein
MLTVEKITARIAELQGLAKQHEAILLQISGAIQEYQNVLAQASVEKGEDDAANQVNGAEGV